MSPAGLKRFQSGSTFVLQAGSIKLRLGLWSTVESVAVPIVEVVVPIEIISCASHAIVFARYEHLIERQTGKIDALIAKILGKLVADLQKRFEIIYIAWNGIRVIHKHLRLI